MTLIYTDRIYVNNINFSFYSLENYPRTFVNSVVKKSLLH